MKTHAFGIKEAEAALASVEGLDGDTLPIVFLIALAIRLPGGLVLLIVKPLPLEKPDAITNRHAVESLANVTGDFLFGERHT